MKLFLTVLLFMPFLSLHAQTTQATPETTKQVFVFKFNPGDSILYDNVFSNGEELQRLSDLIERYRPEIERKEITLFVDGYCASEPTPAANRLMAVTRSNSVKSVLIRYRKLKEDYFKTTNRTVAYEGETDLEIITVHVPGKAVVPAPILPEEKPVVVVEEAKEEVKQTVAAPVDSIPVPVIEQPLEATPEPLVVPTAQVEDLTHDIDSEAKAKELAEREKIVKSYFGETNKKAQLRDREGEWSLRANLLYRLANMLNAGVEWRPTDWGFLFNAGWSGTEWKGGDRKLRLWMVSPEIRRYLGDDNRWFLGVEGHMGKFNIKLSDTGYQGNFMGGGFTGGYRARLSRYFDMDFSLGIGYIYADYDEYYRENCESIQVNEARLKKNIIGPTQAGVSLIWKLK